MTGLKLLADRVDARLLSRATAGHAASIGISGSASFLVAGQVASIWDWQTAFWLSGLCALAAWLIVAFAAPWQEPKPKTGAKLFDFGPVFRNTSALAYSIAYCVHTWEMNAMRGWCVAFLAWVALSTGADSTWFPPTAAATAMGLLGTGVSVFGNELSIRLGRQRLVALAMALSIVCGLTIGWFGSYSYGLAVAFILGYGAVIWLDSSSLTAGAAGAADPARRGATLAVHSMLGYAGGFVGPITIGFALDAAGGMSQLGWGIAFGTLAAAMLAGRIAFVLMRPRDLAGDRVRR